MYEQNLNLKNPYILLTPGPLSTSVGVRSALVRDWCTWDDEYNQGVVQVIRKKLVQLATDADGYTSVLMQGSGTSCVESTIGTCIPKTGAKLLVLVNGAYGGRIAKIAEVLDIPHVVIDFGEHAPYACDVVQKTLDTDRQITHVAMVHCETTTGALNDIQPIAQMVKSYGLTTIVDAMSSFGGIPMDIHDWCIDILISSANKCIQGVPGFGFVIAKKQVLDLCKHNARSLALDLYSQWICMEKNNGKWRFTSPTHTVHAFYHALQELTDEGGISVRYNRYITNQRILVDGMIKLGFTPFLPKKYHSPIITSFFNPPQAEYDFKTFYNKLKQQGFVIYPGKVSHADCFRVGNIGHINNHDMHRFIGAVEKCIYW